MREYLSKKLIIETLHAHKGNAFLLDELSAITEIPKKTLKSQLRHLVHEGKIQKKTLTEHYWNVKGDRRLERPQVWYYTDQ